MLYFKGFQTDWRILVYKLSAHVNLYTITIQSRGLKEVLRLQAPCNARMSKL